MKKMGLETWYRQNKCNEFLNNTDEYFAKMKVVTFDIIKNGVKEDTLKQYQTIDHDEIKQYPTHLQEQISSSIFRNSNRKDMHIKKETIKEHFQNKKVSAERGQFLKRRRFICTILVIFFCKFIVL